MVFIIGNDNGQQQIVHLNVYQLAGGLTINSTSFDVLNKFKPLNKTVNNATDQTSHHLAMASRTDSIPIVNRNKLNKITTRTHQANSDLLLSDLSVHPTTIQPNHHFIRQFDHRLSTCLEDTNKQSVDLIVNQTIAIKQTNQYIRFKRINLSAAQHYLFIIFASNSRGQSEPVEWIFDTGKFNRLFSKYSLI